MKTKVYLNSAIADVLNKDMVFLRKQLKTLSTDVSKELRESLVLEDFEEIKANRKAAISLLMAEASLMVSELQLISSTLTNIRKESNEEKSQYEDGYQTGITWKSNYRPGGPWHWGPDMNSTPEQREKALQSQRNNKAWLKGFDDGYAIQRSTSPELSALK